MITILTFTVLVFCETWKKNQYPVLRQMIKDINSLLKTVHNHNSELCIKKNSSLTVHSQLYLINQALKKVSHEMELWTEAKFPDIWRQTTVIPIPKPGIDNSDPQNLDQFH